MTASPRVRYEQSLRERHRPNHARRTTGSHAAFLLPHLRAGMRLLDIGCGPASITRGLAEAVGAGGATVGVDMSPIAGPVPIAAADATFLPFPDACFDAVFSCATLQHVADPLAVVRDARRVCRRGAIIGIADADWGGALLHPGDPLLVRGQEILAALRPNTNPYVGRELRSLLHDAGFDRATCEAKGFGGGNPVTAMQANFQAAAFDAPEAIAVVIDEGLATAGEMADIAAAWRAFAASPSAVSTGWWFEAVAFVD